MTRRLHPCLTCKPDSGGKFVRRRGFTRHKDQVCGQCRRHGAPSSFSRKGRAA